MTRLLLALSAITLVACSHQAAPAEPSSSSSPAGDSSASTSGGEATTTPATTQTTTTQPAQATVAPISVPLPGIARTAMRPELQELWSKIEDAIAIAPPDAPMAADEAAIATWIEGPFSDWVRRRYRATQDAFAVTSRLTELSNVERGFAVALVAYAYEDMAASARGMPVPPSISNDPNLIHVFAEAIDRALLPIAQYAATGYDGCGRLFAEAADPAWSEWGPFCGEHLQDLREVFGRYARPEPASSRSH